MKAAVLTETGRIEVRDEPPAPLGPADVRIRVRRTGLCGSDIHAFLGTHPFRKPPMVLGHELTGVVVEAGGTVSRLRAGDRVAVEPQITCGACDPCRRGAANVCSRKVVLGTTPWPGSLAETVVVPERTAYPLPDALDDVDGALVEPLAVGVHAARVAGVGLGDRVAVLGAGPIGLACGAAARQAGAGPLLAVDLQPRNLELAAALGATAVATPAEAEAAARQAFGAHGADVVFVGVGKSSVVEQALRVLRRAGGRVVLVALFDEPVTVGDPFTIVGAEAALVGSQMYLPRDIETAIELLAARRVEFRKTVSHEVPLERAGDAFRLLLDRTEAPVKVHVTYD